MGVRGTAAIGMGLAHRGHEGDAQDPSITGRFETERPPRIFELHRKGNVRESGPGHHNERVDQHRENYPDAMTDINTTPPTSDEEVAVNGAPQADRDAFPGFAEMVAAVRAVYDSGRTRPFSWRRSQLEAMLAMLADHETDFVDAIRADLGRPEAEAFGADIGHARMHIRHTIKHFEKWARPKRVHPGMLSLPGSAEVLPEPLGVALVIAPWNYPIQLLLEPMAAALAAGNCMIAKPSEMAPACASVLARLIPRYLDDEAVVLVEGGVDETTALLEQRFDHIFFTGSTAVGRVVMTAAAAHLTPVTLELGGKSPAIVAADADLAVAARRIAWGKFLNAGQTCIAPDYVLADESIRDRLVDSIGQAIESFYGRDPRATRDFGRIVNERHHDRLTALLSGAGGVVAVGGEHDRDDCYVAPTVIVDPDPESALMSQEIFGPILPVVSVASVDEAINLVNAGEKPLALYVFTSSVETADRVLDRTSSGGACVNHTVVHVLPERLAFGGVGGSGMGAYHGRAGFDAFSHLKSVVRKPTRPDPSVMYPPYTTWKERLIRRVFK